MKTLQQFVQDIGKLQASTEQAMKAAPQIMGRNVVNDIHQNFKLQGLQSDKGFEPWEPSRAAIEEHRKTLIDTATMFNSIHYEVEGNKVLVGLDSSLVPYAKYHNEGTDDITKRQFLYVRQSVLKKAMEQVEKLIKVPK